MKFPTAIFVVLTASGRALGSWMDSLRDVTVTETATRTIQSCPCNGEVSVTPVVRGQDFPNFPEAPPPFGPFGPPFPAVIGMFPAKAGPIVAVYSTAGTTTTKTGIVLELEPTHGGHGPGLTTTIWTGPQPTDDLAWIDWNLPAGEDAGTLTRTQTKFTTIYGPAPTNAEHEPWGDWLEPHHTKGSSLSTETSTSSRTSSSSFGAGPVGSSTTPSATSYGNPTSLHWSSSTSVLSISSSSGSGSGIGPIGSSISSGSTGTSSSTTSTFGSSNGSSTTSSSSFTSASTSTLTSSSGMGNSSPTTTSLSTATTSSSSSNGIGPIGGSTTISSDTSSSSFTSTSTTSVSAISSSSSGTSASGSTSSSSTATTTGSASVSASGSSTSSSSSVTSGTSSISVTISSTITSTDASSTTSSSSSSVLLSTSSTFTSTSTSSAQGAVVTDDVRSLSYNDAILEAHNVHRVNHTAANLTWSDNLATIAAEIAASCVYGHNTTAGGGGYGQNIGAGYTSSQVPAMIGNDMYNKEMPNYPLPYGVDNVDTSNFDSWGHFSQIVWKDTQQVGCATQFCPNEVSGADFTQYFTVCNYYPPGNIQGAYSNVGAPLGLPITVELTN